ncbi:MAG: hypothetical protein KDM81_09835 [Verrucomicrobiae bacterium]|nr:hypothetical protein [Verrucomicrobiae bacterium]
MNLHLRRLLAVSVVVVVGMPSRAAEPPFSGTIFLDGDIITATDPSTFESLTEAGIGRRTMFDRRVNGWVTLDALLFDARYADGLAIEIQVNPEFGDRAEARTQAMEYAPVIGRLPHCLRTDVETVWIHPGTEPFGGGNHNLLIHTGQARRYERDGILEETLVHEASHTSLDTTHARAPNWRAAQAGDAGFISTYARDNPDREDVAESFLLYLALRCRSDRIPPALAGTIRRTMTCRIAYFDTLNLDLRPMVCSEPPGAKQVDHKTERGRLVP